MAEEGISTKAAGNDAAGADAKAEAKASTTGTAEKQPVKKAKGTARKPRKTTAKTSKSGGTKRREQSSTVIASPSEEVTKTIVYQSASQVLERDAEPNERFGVGDAMPIYYL